MTVRQDLDKFNGKMEQDVENMEARHDERVIEKEKERIAKDKEKMAEHEKKLAADEKEKQGFIKKTEEKVEEMLIHHDEHEVEKREAKIVREQERDSYHKERAEATAQYDAEVEANKK